MPKSYHAPAANPRAGPGDITSASGTRGESLMGRIGLGVGGGVFGAVAGAVLFWMINQSVQVNKVGLLRRQVWPVNDLWFWVGLGFALGFLGGVVLGARRAAHAQAARELA